MEIIYGSCHCEDGLTATMVKQPAVGEAAVKELWQPWSHWPEERRSEVPTVKAIIGENDEYGYLLNFYFIRKIPMDMQKRYCLDYFQEITEQWDPLNGRNQSWHLILEQQGSRTRSWLTIRQEPITSLQQTWVFRLEYCWMRSVDNQLQHQMNIGIQRPDHMGDAASLMSTSIPRKKQDNLGMMWAPGGYG